MGHTDNTSIAAAPSGRTYTLSDWQEEHGVLRLEHLGPLIARGIAIPFADWLFLWEEADKHGDWQAAVYAKAAEKKGQKVLHLLFSLSREAQDGLTMAQAMEDSFGPPIATSRP